MALRNKGVLIFLAHCGNLREIIIRCGMKLCSLTTSNDMVIEGSSEVTVWAQPHGMKTTSAWVDHPFVSLRLPCRKGAFNAGMRRAFLFL